jgi:c-di-GMP-binding flagellar brake protein YcgR
MESDHPAPAKNTVERRRQPRCMIHLPLDYRKVGTPKMYPDHTANISEGGLMLSGAGRIEVGEGLESRIYYSSRPSFAIIPAIVRVVWTDLDPKEVENYQFGVSFINISPRDKEALKFFLEDYAHPR